MNKFGNSKNNSNNNIFLNMNTNNTNKNKKSNVKSSASIIMNTNNTNKIKPITLKSDYLNQKLISEKIKNKNSILRNFDSSNEISLDQVEAKLNRFSIAKDSLESSLVNLPY